MADNLNQVAVPGNNNNHPPQPAAGGGGNGGGGDLLHEIQLPPAAAAPVQQTAQQLFHNHSDIITQAQTHVRVSKGYTIQGIGFNDIVIDDNGVFTGIYNEATGIFYNISNHTPLKVYFRSTYGLLLSQSESDQRALFFTTLIDAGIEYLNKEYSCSITILPLQSIYQS